METISPEVLTSLVLTSGLALAMVVLRRRDGKLELRTPPSKCRSCGRWKELGRRCQCKR